MATWILLRGLARESGHWGRFAAQLKDSLPPTERVVALDLPGTGALRDRRSPARAAGIAIHCRQQAQAQGWPRPFVLLALSLGGMVALDWERQEPAEIAGCVLINTSMRKAGWPWERLKPSSWLPLARLLLPGLNAQHRERAVLALTSRRPARQAEVLARWTALAEERPMHRGNVLRQLLAAAAFAGPHRPPTAPMLLLASAGDALVSWRCSQRLAERWRWPIRIHPDAGHDLPLDDPEWVIREARDWWTGLGRAA